MTAEHRPRAATLRCIVNLLVGLGAAACGGYDPNLPVCLIACTTDDQCPSGLACSGGKCGAEGCTTDLGPVADGGADADTESDMAGNRPPLDVVYVSSSRGSADGDGTKTRPLSTLTAGLALAQQAGVAVRACAEDYLESLTLLDGVSVNGSFDCQHDWVQSSMRAFVRAPTSPAVTARGLTHATRIEAFNFVAPDVDVAGPSDAGDVAGGSSIGVSVRDSRALTFVQVLVHGGKAARGADGVAGKPNLENGTPTGGSGLGQGVCSSAFPPPGFPGLSLPCKGPKANLGGSGGKSQCAVGAAGGPGGLGGPGLVSPPGIPCIGAGGDVSGFEHVATPGTAIGGSGSMLPGAPGARGADGSDGVNGAWTFDVNGFTPGDGSAGSGASPGQGGGGGAGVDSYMCSGGACCPAKASVVWSASGSGGGAGGCGGLPGTPGKGGGASIGVLSVASEVRFEQSKIESSTGGAAGRGALGSLGLLGGAPGPTSGGGRGGVGGVGGVGGLSGHGAPGPSIALAYTGPRPDTVLSELLAGPAGEGQPELKQVATKGLSVLPAVVGESKAEHHF